MTDLTPGVPSALSPMVRRIVAPNPGMMTGPGTNTYLVGIDEIAVIDPGPDDPSHLDAIVSCGGVDNIRWILATHTHSDHSPGVAPLAQRVRDRGGEVEVLGFGARDGFEPDREIGEGFELEATEFRLRALHTPGHASNHLCYLLDREKLLFSGDHIMSGSTVVIAPPDGDMSAYLSSLGRLKELKLEAIAPGHGPLIEDPNAVIDGYVEHRLAREEAVASALASAGAATVADLVPAVYADVPADRHGMARYSLWAHLQKLHADGRVRAGDPGDLHTTWEWLDERTASARRRRPRPSGGA